MKESPTQVHASLGLMNMLSDLYTQQGRYSDAEKVRFRFTHVTARHLTSLHCTSSRHCTSLHVTSLHVTSLHVTSLHVTSLHATALYVTSLHVTSLHATALHVCPSAVFLRANARASASVAVCAVAWPRRVMLLIAARRSRLLVCLSGRAGAELS